MDFATELQKALELKMVIEILLMGCTKLHPEYLLLNSLVIKLTLGEIVQINTDCEGETCQVETQDPHGGLWETYQELKGVIETLEMELHYLDTAKMEPDYYL